MKGKLAKIYAPLSWGSPAMKKVEPTSRYQAYLFNPVDGAETDLGAVAPDANGDWLLPFQKGSYRNFPIYQDWVIVLEAPGARQ